MSAPGVTWEHTLYPLPVRRGIAAAALVSALAGVGGPAVATAAEPARVAAQPDTGRPSAPDLRADRAHRPDPFAVHIPPAAAASTATAAVPPVVAPPPQAPAAPPPVAVPVQHRPVTKHVAAAPRPARPARPARAETAAAPLPPAGGAAAAVVAFARAQLGKPYVYGAAGPGAYDCSGLVLAAYRQIGIGLPHKASSLFGVGHAVSAADIRPGDILVLEGGGHAAIAIGGGMMIHASRPGRPVAVAKIYARPDAVRRLVG